MKTTRVQRKRVKGWRKPEGAVYIGRGSKYGNPYSWKTVGKPEAVRLYREWLPQAIEKGEVDLNPLKGKTIMCFCSTDEPCHGDVIIETLHPKE